MFACDIKPQPHLSGSQITQQSFLNYELFEATSLSTNDYFFCKLWVGEGSQQEWEESAQAPHSVKM